MAEVWGIRPWEIPLLTVDEIAVFMGVIRQRRKDADKAARERGRR